MTRRGIALPVRKLAMVALLLGAAQLWLGPVSLPTAEAAGSAHGVGSNPGAPDFNGDGFPDVAATALYEDVGTFTDVGAVTVLYGSAAGVQADAPANQFWTAGVAGVQAPAQSGEQFGWCTTFGDFNADGYTDLAVCIPYLDVNGVTDAGAVDVLYGSAGGLQADGTGGPDDQLWYQGAAGMQGQPEAVDALGRSATAGDFNGDGFGDLAVEIRGQDVDGVSDAGAVAVLYGAPGGLQATGTGAPDDQLWTQNSPGVEDQSENSDWFGRNLATGDFNADGYSDLAAGAFLEDVGTIKDAGGVEVLYGSADGLQAEGITGPADQFWTQDSPGVQDLSETGDYFGHTVASGDFNGDGYDDLAISSRLEDISAHADAGGVEILYGTNAGLQADAPDDQFWTQDSPNVQDQTRPGDQFGFSLAVGDFNADGLDDLAIGVPFKNIQPNPDTGKVAVLYGSAAGLQATGTGGPDDQIWFQGTAGVQDQPEKGDSFGISLAASDLNGDGDSDLAVGINGESVGSLRAAGAVAVLYGSSAGLQAASPDDQLWTQDSPNVLDNAEVSDQLGWWVT